MGEVSSILGTDLLVLYTIVPDSEAADSKVEMLFWQWQSKQSREQQNAWWLNNV